jgi:hypothetical protein
MRCALSFVLALTVLAAGCDSNTPTSPTTTPTTTTTVAEPTMTVEFTSTLPVGGTKFYSFTTTQNGTINITLTNVNGALVPSTVMLGLGLGQPSGTDCVTTTTLTTAAGSTAQITGTYAPGVYCAWIADVGNLFASAAFTVIISFP